MTRQALTIGAVAAALALSVAPSSWAAPQAGSRPNTGETVGSAVPRGGGEGSSSSGTTSSSSGSSSSGSSMGAGSPGTSSGSNPWGNAGPMRREAPERPNWTEQRRGGGNGSGERAVPRGSSATAGGSSTGSATSAGAGNDRSGGSNNAPVPTYSRPRGNRPAVGAAGERVGAVPERGGSNGQYSPVYYDPYYYSGGFYSGYGSYYGYGYNPFYRPWGYSPYMMPGYGFGVGYFGYDPWADPFYGGYGYQGYGYDDPYQGGYSGGGYTSSQSYDTGSLRLKVKPGNAQVFVDGYYVGTIDSFDGAFQRLSVAAGAHKIELRADGYQPEQFDVLVKPGETLAYKGDLKPIR